MLKDVQVQEIRGGAAQAHLVVLAVAWPPGTRARQWKIDVARISADLYEATDGRRWALHLPVEPETDGDSGDVVNGFVLVVAEPGKQPAEADVAEALAILQSIGARYAALTMARALACSEQSLLQSETPALAARPIGVRARGFTVQQGMLCVVTAPTAGSFPLSLEQVCGAWEAVPVAQVLAEAAST